MILTKKLKQIFFCIFILFITNTFLFAEIFTFKAKNGQKFNIECNIFGYQVVNDDKQNAIKNEQQYKTIRTIKSVKTDETGTIIATINDNSLYFNQNTINNKTVELKNNDDTTYSRDQYGLMKVQENAIFPTMRDAPVFPKEDIQPGATWFVQASEIQDFFNDNHKSVFPFNVFYKFLGYEEGDNKKKLAKFEYNYEFDIQNNENAKIDSRILEVKGKAKTTMFFDNELGSRTEEFYERDYYIFIDNGDYSSTSVHITDNGIRTWTPIKTSDEDSIIIKLQEKLTKEGLTDTQIVHDDKGIKLVLENIQFEPDSAILLPKEKHRLDKIGRMLEEYNNKSLMIVGHTTDRGTEQGREELSLERAKSVTDYLKNKQKFADTKMYYLGKADKEPIADNSTRIGREKNRRVEIFLIDE